MFALFQQSKISMGLEKTFVNIEICFGRLSFFLVIGQWHKLTVSPLLSRFLVSHDIAISRNKMGFLGPPLNKTNFVC